MPKRHNLLFIISDEHNPKVMGCSGDPLVLTPHLDRIASQGVRFSSAYCNSPACVPARAALATGRYVHDLELWDNAHPYDGSVASWHRRLRDSGMRVASIGKLHFRSTEDDNGFGEEIVPMHVVDGVGDLGDLVRDKLPRRGGIAEMANAAGPGESSYTRYDRDIAARAQAWMAERAAEGEDGQPWALFVSLVAPHFPLTAPDEHYYRYFDSDRLPRPKLYGKEERPRHPYLLDYAGSLAYDDYFDSELKLRRALAGYYGLVSFLDELVGELLRTLDAQGLGGSTRIVYTSDHGENLGARGLWGKTTMYEESVGVPLLLAGPGVPQGLVCATPVTHVDLFPTVLEATGTPASPEDAGLPGRSLFPIIGGQEPGRSAFAEFHGMGSSTASYMVRDGRYKYVYYVGYPAQLFDLQVDPEELSDIAALPESMETVRRLHGLLCATCDPEEVDARAKRQQADMLARSGGREAVLAKGDFSFSPAPGTEAVFETGDA